MWFALFLALATAEARDPTDALNRHQRWIGKPISLKTANADVADLLRLIGEASGFNIVLSDGVRGQVRALDWQDVPWDQALDTLLKTKHLHAERDGNMLRVMTYPEYERELSERR